VIQRLERQCRNNMPSEVRVAVPYYRPGSNLSGRKPDFYLHETDAWFVLPYELQGLTREEIAEHKPAVAALLDSSR